MVVLTNHTIGNSASDKEMTGTWLKGQRNADPNIRCNYCLSYFFGFHSRASRCASLLLPFRERRVTIVVILCTLCKLSPSAQHRFHASLFYAGQERALIVPIGWWVSVWRPHLLLLPGG